MLYAAYGSNLHPGRLRQRVPGAELLGTATLSHWRLAWHKRGMDGSAKCDIVPHDGKRVHIAVFHFSDRDLPRLDRAEGHGRGYEHHWLDLADFGQVLTYRAASTHIDDSLLAYEWYRAYVLAGCRFHDFDSRYIEAIRGLAHRPDPDPGRHQRHMAHLAALHHTPAWRRKG